MVPPGAQQLQPLSATAALVLACPLSSWTGQPQVCRWCSCAISGRRTAWCSDRCRRSFERNHLWRHARIHARRLAGYRCTRPGCPAARFDLEINHIGMGLQGRGYGPSCAHHQQPDAHSGSGGLEGLCHAHHAEVSAQQARDRAITRRTGDRRACTGGPTSTAAG